VAWGSAPHQAEFPSHVWTYDFLQDACVNGQKLRLLTVVDEFTRECLATGSREAETWRSSLFRKTVPNT
jgi:hypothetical protein